MSTGTILLAAGGTGGHLFPAEALAQALTRRGARVELVSDERVEKYAENFPASAVHEIAAGTVTGGGIIGKALGALALARGVLQCRALLDTIKPAIVVGFGGYPTVPPVLAATHKRIVTIIHDQNAVMGRANRFLAPRVTAIATGFPLHDAKFASKTTHVGNPVRARVLGAAQIPYPQALRGGRLRLLVFGGSQGARVMGEVVPAAIELLGKEHFSRLCVVQQAREEDFARVRGDYERLGVEAEVYPFFKDLPERMAAAHLIIARSGASTVAELSVIGRPSILVPLPHALDQDQAANARVLAHAGAAKLVPQSEFTPTWLSRELARRLAEPEQLTGEAAQAKAAGIPDAAERLSDLVLKHARQG